MNSYLKQLITRFPELERLQQVIELAAGCIADCYLKGGKLLICGNGGSSADSDHIAGELMKGFMLKRETDNEFKKRLISVAAGRGKILSEKLQKGLPAISLSAHSSLVSAIANDSDPDIVYAQQVAGYGKKGDVLLGISTSGNAVNVVDAVIAAKAMDLKVIGLTGESGGQMRLYCDILINVPGSVTYMVQELHLPVYHTICLMVEDTIFGNQT